VGPLSPWHGTSSGCGWREVLQIQRVAANILNKQSRTADKGWSSSFLGALLMDCCSKCSIISRAPRKPTHWYRYVDDTFVVWPHGEEELRKVLDHLNSIHHNIKFTMEVEKNQSLPFLDVLVSRRPDGSLEHSLQKNYTYRLVPPRKVRTPPSPKERGLTLTHTPYTETLRRRQPG
jgi:hypothetical protein